MPIDIASWYDPNPDETALYQGDVIDNVPVVIMPPAGDGPWVLLRPTQDVTLKLALEGKTPLAFKPHAESNLADAWKNGDEFVLARGTRRRVIVTTQTCDIENRKHVHVAPVLPLSALTTEQKKESVRKNEVLYFFFLPNDEYADLSLAVLAHKSYLKRGQLVRRLTTHATIELQSRLATMQARTFGFTTKDLIPQDADYACISCFTKTGKGQRTTFKANGKFPVCPVCGEDVRWIKLPAAAAY